MWYKTVRNYIVNTAKTIIDSKITLLQLLQAI